MKKCFNLISNNYVYIILIIFFILALFNMQVFGPLTGVLVGWLISQQAEKQKEIKRYIINAQNVILILIKQINEFINIKQHFDSAKADFISPLDVSPTEWRLTKKEIISLNTGHPEIIYILDKLIHEDKYYKDLIEAVNDYGVYCKQFPVINVEIMKSINESEKLKSIKERLLKSELKEIFQMLRTHLILQYPMENIPNIAS